MNMITFNNLNGQSVEILQLWLNREEADVSLQLTLLLNGEAVSLRCKNIHGLMMDELSYPMQIAGFEIVDNSDKGWEASQRYTVRDYEDGKIGFYCETIEVLQFI